MKKTLLALGILVAVAGVGVAVFLGTRSTDTTQTTPQKLTGTYRCWQYNVDGAGGSCRLVPPFVFEADYTYAMSSEKGTYTVAGTTLNLSESQIRGPGTILENGNQIRFEYDYSGRHTVVTYLREGSPSTETEDGAPSTVTVDITVNFSRADSGVESINSVSLVPVGYTFDNAPIRYDALAIVTERQYVAASFFGNKEVETGKVYEVYTDSGFEKLRVGTLDLQTVTGPVTEVYTYQIP